PDARRMAPRLDPRAVGDRAGRLVPAPPGASLPRRRSLGAGGRPAPGRRAAGRRHSEYGALRVGRRDAQRALRHGAAAVRGRRLPQLSARRFARHGPKVYRAGARGLEHRPRAGRFAAARISVRRPLPPLPPVGQGGGDAPGGGKGMNATRRSMPLLPALEVVASLRREEIVVTTMGSAREWPKLSGHALDFHYLPSAMGQAPMLGLGLALAQPSREVMAFNGDGCMLMNLGCLVTIAASGATNFTLI